jgi:trehalose-phosphatase
VKERGEAVPYPGVRERLSRLVSLARSHVAIVSGRAAASLVPLLGLDSTPEIWGSHGRERRSPDGRLSLFLPEPEAQCAIGDAHRIAAAAGFLPHLEPKPAGVAVHLRGANEETQSRVTRFVEDQWRPIADANRLDLMEFDGGFELRAPGRTKGSVVQELLDQCEIGAEDFAAYFGDDQTDEDAFRALGDRGLSILVRDDPRPSLAKCWIRPPDTLIQMLDIWADADTVKA